MVNKTQFYKTKVALAVVLSLGLAACGDSDGDEGSTATSTTVSDATQNTVGNQNELTGTVQGVVVDSNANPIAGVMVYLGDAETVTNAGGQYVFTNVAVTNVSGVNNEGDEAIDGTTSTLVVTIGGTAEYLGALVTVTPQAQVNNTGGQGDNQSGGNSDTTIQTFIDGFTAEAGVAVLPMLNAGAYGYIRDCRTGAPLANAADVLSLDFISVSSDAATVVVGNGTQLTNAEDTHAIASDADGMFSLTGLAANSSYAVSAKQGWTITSGLGQIADPAVATTFTTTSEGSSELLNTIEVCPVGFTASDVTPGSPYIKSVAGSIGTTTGADTYEHVVLTKGVDGTDGITLNFSEAISAGEVDLGDVVVTRSSGSAQVVVDIAINADGSPQVTLAADGKSLTVVLADALADEQRFSIWFPKWQYKDNRANEIVTGDDLADNAAPSDDLLFDTYAGDGAGSDEFGIISDMIRQEPGKVSYVRTRLCTYIAPPETPEGLTGEQLVKTLDASLLAVSPTWDNSGDADATTATNLNGQENATAGRDTGERLETRFGGTITNDKAVIVGSVDNASGIAGAVVAGTGGGTVGAASFNASTGAYSIAVDDTFHGTQVVVTPTGAFGVSGTPVTVTLEDKVAPTTILQENYELWAIEADYSATTVSSGTGAVGSGGEVAEGSVTGDAGDPIIYIQPRHLTQTDANNRSIANSEFEAFAFADDFVDGATANSIYSGPGFAAWDERGNSLGVAFSETIATTATAPDESASVDVELTGVLNGLTTDVDGNLILGTVDTAGNNVIPKTGEDLARFTVSDMIAFANNDHDEAIDFTNGSMQDTRDNLANANSDARVVIRDAMPAFITAAYWDGSNVVMTFNETIVPDGAGVDADVFTFTDLVAGGPGFDLTLSSVAVSPAQGAYSLNPAGTQLTVAVDAANVQGLFQNGADDVYLFDSNGDGDAENHVALTFDTIEDTRGNSWATFDRDLSATALGDTVNSDNLPTGDAQGDDRQGRYLVNAPRFMAYNDVGIFTITKQTLGYEDVVGAPNGDDNGLVTVRFTFSHPIDLDGTALGGLLDAAALGATFAGPSMTLAEANAIFQLDLDGPALVSAPADFLDVGLAFSATFSSDYKTIEVDMAQTPNTVIAGAAQVIFQAQVDSSITDEFLANETYTVVNSN